MPIWNVPLAHDERSSSKMPGYTLSILDELGNVRNSDLIPLSHQPIGVARGGGTPAICLYIV